MTDVYKVASRLESKIPFRVDNGGDPPTGYGVCDSCGRFNWKISQYGTMWVWCEPDMDKKVPLRSTDPVVNCSNYYRRGALSMQEMVSMATLIDINRRTIGFGPNTSEEVTVQVTPPDDEEEK